MPKQHLITGQKIDPARLQQAKALRRNMTPAERRLWAELRGNRLDGFHFRHQQIIDGFIADFYCHAASLVVEVDGPVHNEQADQDAERDRILAARGLHVLQVRNEEVMQNLGEVLTLIRRACHARADLTPQPPSLRGKGEKLPSPTRGGAGGEVPSLRRVGAGDAETG